MYLQKISTLAVPFAKIFRPIAQAPKQSPQGGRPHGKGKAQRK